MVTYNPFLVKEYILLLSFHAFLYYTQLCLGVGLARGTLALDVHAVSHKRRATMWWCRQSVTRTQPWWRRRLQEERVHCGSGNVREQGGYGCGGGARRQSTTLWRTMALERHCGDTAGGGGSYDGESFCYCVASFLP